MFGKKLVGNEIEPKCKYCQFGEAEDSGEAVLCPKKGRREPDDSCRKFVYDPLKRTFRRPKPLQTFSAEDFEL